jgi:hypothetical protein
MMPPPLMSAYLKENINLLKQEVIIRNVKAEADKVKSPNTLPLLDKNLNTWLSGLNSEQLSQKYGIDDIIKLAGLKGLYKELPARQMVALALYKCGFKQVRLWGKPFRNKRLWILNSTLRKRILESSKVD